MRAPCKLGRDVCPARHTSDASLHRPVKLGRDVYGRVDSGLTCTGDRRQALGNHPNGHTLTRWQHEAREGALEVEPVRVPHSCAGRHLPHKRYPADTREEALRLLRLGRRSASPYIKISLLRWPGPAPASSTDSGSRWRR